MNKSLALSMRHSPGPGYLGYVLDMPGIPSVDANGTTLVTKDAGPKRHVWNQS